MTRRSFIARGLASLVVVEAGWAAGRLGSWGIDQTLGRRLARYYRDTESAKVVGLEYLRAVPSETSADVLIDLLCSIDRQRFARADDATLRELLQRRQREEFAQDRVVAVRGWILSRTECRLCALAAVL